MKLSKTFIVLSILWLVLLPNTPTLAGPTTITIDYMIPCNASMQTMTLGQFTATAHNGSDKWLDVTFTVASDVQSHGIWNCMELHWLQTIWHDDEPVDYKGSTPTFPVIDPPKDGWDYQNNQGSDGYDNDQDGLIDEADEAINADGRDNNGNGVTDEAGETGDDAAPWYLNPAEEDNYNVTGKSYYFSDNPSDTTPGYTGFSTYLCAVATDFCPLQPSDCLAAGEILVLGGFDWTISSTLCSVFNEFSQATSGDLAEISVALSNSGFSGWSVVNDKAICCVPVPVPTSLVLVAMGLTGISAIRRRRSII